MRLAEFTRKAFNLRLADVQVALPVVVTAYDLIAQTVDVQPLIKNLTEAEDGAEVKSLPLLTSVPVAFPRAGGFFVTFPIVPGDTGQIIVCDRSIDNWHKKGGEVEPLDRRVHSFDGAVFYPGLSDSLSPLADAHATDMVIGEDGGSSIHLLPGGEIQIGAAPTDYVALAALVATELTRIQGELDAHKTVFDAHVHILAIAAAAGAGGTGTAAPPAAGFAGGSAPASVAATNVKAD